MAQRSLAPAPSNIHQPFECSETYVVYLENAVIYLDHQVERAREEIKNLRIDLARAKGENMRALGVVR